MISGILIGLLLIALSIFIFVVLRRRKDDQNDDQAVYDTETEAAEEMIDTDLSDFGDSANGGSFVEETGLEGGFALSDAFAQNPEESRLFF
jgi:hypothetical protein